MLIQMSFLDSAIDDQIEADDQAGELDSYMMQKWVLDKHNNNPVGSDCDHPGDSVEVINAIYNIRLTKPTSRTIAVTIASLPPK